MTERDLQPKYAPGYVALLPWLIDIARAHGYALGVHGSLRTDLDLIAAPWMSDAKPADVLIAAICAAVGGVVQQRPPPCPACAAGRTTSAKNGRPCTHIDPNPSLRPHGRLAYAIHFEHGGPYIDISVMPRVVLP